MQLALCGGGGDIYVYHHRHTVQVAMHADMCTSANTTNASCRGSRASWALVGAGCNNQLQVALGQDLVRECALVSDSIHIAAPVEQVVVQLLIAAAEVDDGGILVAVVGVGSVVVSSAAQLLFVGPACEPAEWSCFL